MKTSALIFGIIPFALFAQTTLTVPGGGNVTHCAGHVDYPGTKAFDRGGNGDGARWLAARTALPDAFVTYSFNVPTVVNGYAVFGLASSNSGADRSPKSWSLEGTDDMADPDSWVLADAQTNQTAWTSLQVRRFTAASTHSFLHWRFTMHEQNAANDYVGIQELEFYDLTGFAEAPKFSASAHTPTGPDSVRVNGSLDEGFIARVWVAWGDASDNLANTNEIGNVGGPFGYVLPGLVLNQTYWYTFYGTNKNGRAELSAPLSFTVVPFPVNLTWSGAGIADNSWHDPDNWSPAQVPTRIDPVTINANAPSTDPITINAPAQSAGVTFGAFNNAINISADWLVNGSVTSSAANGRTINQTSGTVTIANAFNFNQSSALSLNISGANTAFIVTNSMAVGCYRNLNSLVDVSGYAYVEVRDFTMGVESGGSGRGELTLRGNASMLVKNNASIGSSYPVATCIVTNNASLTAGNELSVQGNGSRLLVYDGAQVGISNLRLGNSNNSYAHVRQYGGDVLVGTFNAAGNGQGGTGTGNNNRYTMDGGTLAVNNLVSIGVNGQAIFEQSGGFAEFKGGATVKGTASTTASQLIFNEGAKIACLGTVKIGNDATANQRGIFRVVGNAAGNGNLSFVNLHFGAGGAYEPVINQNGFTPVHVSNQLRVYNGFVVRPEVTEPKLFGEYTILTWQGLNTTTPEQLEEWVQLAPGYDPEQWKLVVKPAQNKVVVRYFARSSLIIIK